MGTNGHTKDSRTASAAFNRRGRLAIARRRVGLFAASLVVAGLAASAVAGSASAAVAGCDRVAATNGSDAAPGTTAAPFATPQKLIGSLAPGQTGCLRAGVYVWSGDLSIRTPGVRVASFPGERATLQGRLRIEATADGAVVEDLTLDGRNSNNNLSPLVYADGAVLRDNEITNHHSEICVHVTAYPGAGPPRGVVIEGNRIHDCGSLPATNMDHGIYIGEARDTVIRDNWIYDNADRGIQLYPDADGTLVTGNVIDGNGQGVAIGGSGSQTSDNNLVEHNVITNSTIRYNVEGSWGSSVGTGNVVRENCTIGGARGRRHRRHPDPRGRLRRERQHRRRPRVRELGRR